MISSNYSLTRYDADEGKVFDWKEPRYDEILIDEKENLKPDYIICYDEILDEDIMLSKKMNIPIVIIYTKFYKEAFNNKSGIESPFNDVLKYKKL